MDMNLYPEIEQDRQAALRLIVKLWGWDGVNEWNKTINKRIAEKLSATAANVLPNFVFLDFPKGNGREGEIVIEAVIERCEKCNYPSSADTQCINCGTCLVCAWDGSPGTEDMCPRCDRRREYWDK